MKDIATTLRTFVVENYLFGQVDGFTDQASFLERGIVDSTGMLEVIAFLEETYNIKVEDDELLPENLDSINKLTKFVQRKRRGETANAN